MRLRSGLPVPTSSTLLDQTPWRYRPTSPSPGGNGPPCDGSEVSVPGSADVSADRGDQRGKAFLRVRGAMLETCGSQGGMSLRGSCSHEVLKQADVGASVGKAPQDVHRRTKPNKP